ncbi:bifunctional DNA primase/polymerase [Streptomyces sp. NPDC004752]
MPAELPFSHCGSRQEFPHALAAPRQSLLIARWCAYRGWPVHPLAPGGDTPAPDCISCRRPGHTAARCACPAAGRWCHGPHAATRDLQRIEDWWGAHPGFGVGVACGPAGLVVIDIDAHPAHHPAPDRLLPGIQIGSQVDLTGLRNGFHTLAVLAALRNQPSPADDTGTLRVRTPSGGLHVWYRVADNRRWQCSADTAARHALAWQVDVRAHGRYTVAPGTITGHGTYTLLEGACAPAPLPSWLAHELERTGHVRGSRSGTPRGGPVRQVFAGGGRARVRGTLRSVLDEVAVLDDVAVRGRAGGGPAAAAQRPLHPGSRS